MPFRPHSHPNLYEAKDADLTAIAALTPTDDDFIQRKSGVWVNRSIAQVVADLAIPAGAPTGADYLVGTANGGLSAEIVVGTAPGGELGGTWASPTVDATHAGSTHVALGTSPSTQAFGDAAAGGAATDAAKTDHKHGMPADPVTAHAAASDPHTGYVLESLFDAKGDLIAASADNTPAKLTVGADDTILMADAAAAAGLKWVAAASPAAVGTAAATGTADTFTRGDHVHAHETAHTGHDTIWDAKGDLAVGTGADAAAKLTVGADDTILMADAAQSTGLKWVASATPSTQAFADAAAVGTGDTFTRGDHKHAMPTLGYGLSGNSAPAVGLTQTSAFATATTSISAATYADVTGVSVSLAAGTWLIMARCNGSIVNAQAIMHVAITDGANAIVVEGSQGIGASGTANVAQLGNVSLCAIVSPGSTTTYKMRAARGLTTITGTWVAMDGAGTNTTNNLTDNSDKGTGIFAVRIA